MYVVTLTDGSVRIDADDHRVEGQFHVFRSTTTLMGRPRAVVVRRLPVGAVVDVAERR